MEEEFAGVAERTGIERGLGFVGKVVAVVQLVEVEKTGALELVECEVVERERTR